MEDLTLRSEDDYAFADAYIGCHTARLMKQQDLVRLANCDDLHAAQTILQEFDYGDAKELEDDDIEWFIRKEQTKLYDLIFHGLPGREELAPYLYPFDYHNVKVCIKSELLGLTPSEEHLISSSDTDWKMIVAMVRDRNYAAMRPTMRDAVQEVLDVYGRTGDPQEIDIILDKACYKDVYLKSVESGSDFLVDMAKITIDTVNIKAFARLKKMNKPWSFFKKVFVEDGVITEDFFISNYEDSLPQFGEKVVDPHLNKALIEGGRELDETGSFALLEKLLNDAVMEHNRKARDYVEGIEPIAGYWYAKEDEIDNIRIILNGILAKMDPDDIIPFLSKTYLE